MPDFRKTIQTALIGVLTLLQAVCFCHGNFCAGASEYHSGFQETHAGQHGHSQLCVQNRNATRAVAPANTVQISDTIGGALPEEPFFNRISAFAPAAYPPVRPDAQPKARLFLRYQQLLC